VPSPLAILAAAVTRRLATTLAALALVPAVGACGGSEEDKAKSAVQDYLSAVADAKGDKACGLVTAQARRAIERSGRPCPDTISGLDKVISDRFKDAGVENVKITGATATAEVKLNGAPAQRTLLRREGGGWKLASSSVP
jgi:hypothetical protein